MYHGEVLIMKDQLQSFLQTAEVLQVSGLIGCTNFPIKNVLTSNKVIKPQKTANKSLESDILPKKAKVTPKSKSKVILSPTTSAINENLSMSPKETMHKVQTSPTHEKFEVINVDKIKTEVEDDIEPLEDEKLKLDQCPLLEAALEVKDNPPSILERSLTLLSTSEYLHV